MRGGDGGVGRVERVQGEKVVSAVWEWCKRGETLL